MNKTERILDVTQQDCLNFIYVWFILFLFDRDANANRNNVEKYKKDISAKFSAEVSFITEGDELKGFSIKWKDIINNLKKDNIPEEVIELIKTLPNINSDEKFEFIDGVEDGVVGEFGRRFEEIVAAISEFQQYFSDKENNIDFWTNPEYFNSLSLSKCTESGIAWMRAALLFAQRRQLIQNLGSNNILNLFCLEFFELIFDIFNIKMNKFSPSALFPLFDWVSYNGSKTPTFVFDNLDLVQFLAVACIRIENLDICVNIKNKKEMLIFCLLRKLIEALPNLLESGTYLKVHEVAKVSQNSPLVGSTTAIRNFVQNNSFKFKSRKLFIFNKYLKDVLECKKIDDVIEFAAKWERLLLVKSVIRINSLSSQSKWNICLYDEDFCPKKFGYTDFSNLNSYATNRFGERVDYSIAAANAFQKVIKYYTYTEYFVDYNLFSLVFSGFYDLDLCMKAKGELSRSLEQMLSEGAYSIGNLSDFVTITRGQVLKTKDTQLHVGYEINPGDISESGLIDFPKKIILNLDSEKNQRYKLKKGDILIGVKGLVGTVGFIDQDVDNWYAGQAIAILRLKDKYANSKVINSEFIFLHFKNKNTQNLLVDICMANKSKSLDMDKLRNIPISVQTLPMNAYHQKCKKLFDAWREFKDINESIDHLSAYDNNLSYLALTSPEFMSSNPNIGKSVKRIIQQVWKTVYNTNKEN